MGAPDTAFVKQYQDSITILAQQRDSRFENCVRADYNFTGENKFYDQYASDDLVELVGRYEDTPTQLPDHRRRMVSPRYFVGNTLEDPKDALQMLIDPKSTYMQAKRMACNRKKDDIIISAFGGTAYTGKTGTTTQANTNSIAATFGSGSSNSGLTKAKVLRAAKILNAGEVEKEDRYLGHTAVQLEDLLNTTEVASSDYNSVKALVQGELNTWVGFTFKHSERFSTNASSHRLIYAWQKMGVQFAISKDVEGRVTERPDKNYAWQVYVRMCIAATRLEEARVVEIICAES